MASMVSFWPFCAGADSWANADVVISTKDRKNASGVCFKCAPGRELLQAKSVSYRPFGTRVPGASVSSAEFVRARIHTGSLKA